MKNLLSTGEITGTHGLYGHLRVRPYSGEIKHLLRLRKVSLTSDGWKDTRRIESARSAGKDVLIKLRGIDDVEAAKTFVNKTLWVSRSRAAAKRRSEYYVADLTGCEVVSARRKVGKVKAIFDSGPNIYLEIDKPDKNTVVLPFIDRYFGKINIRKRQIEIRELWLLE